MSISLREYLADATARDIEAEKEALVLGEDADDSFDDELSALIDEHPIGLPVSRCGHTID